MPAYLNNLVGRVFGRWVIKRDMGIRDGVHVWKAQCECGTVRDIAQGSFRYGASRSCGCLKRDTDRGRLKHDYAGEVIGRLTVICQTEPLPRRWGNDRKPLGVLMRMWRVRCLCGKEKIVQTQALRRQKEQGHASCGCWAKEINRSERQKRTRPYEFYLNRIKASARPRNIEVSLTYEELLLLLPEGGKGECHYCGEVIFWNKYDLSKNNANRKTGHNFDRRDNGGPYSKENLILCCGGCNKTRGDRFTYDEFILLAPILRKIREQRLRLSLRGAA